MKIKVKKLSVLVMSVLSVMVSVSAWADFVPLTQEEAPTVPIEVVSQSRAAVTEYIANQGFDHVTLHYSGHSLVRDVYNYISGDELRQNGYVHPGQFTELVGAVANIPFSQDVVKTPDGYYDVNIEIRLYDTNQKVAMIGYGYLPISEGPDGGLSAGTFQVAVDINESVLTFPLVGKGSVVAARWLGSNGRAQDLNVLYGPSGIPAGVILPSSVFGQGYLIESNEYGQLSGADLSTGKYIQGQKIITMIGRLTSLSIISLRDPDNLSSQATKNVQFYTSDDGRVYGRFPVIDLVLDQPINSLADFSVPVWGGNQWLLPVAVYVTPVYFVKDVQPGWTIGQEYQAQWTDKAGGGFIMNLPAGGYHIRVEFQDVLDWSANSGPTADPRKG